jgi:hypothetical protein
MDFSGQSVSDGPCRDRAPDQAKSDRPETVSGIPSSAERAVAASAAQRQRSAVSPETLRLYAGDWAAFEDWCRQRGFASLHADAARIAAFLSEAATTLSAGARTRRAAAIAAKHRQSGLTLPVADPAVRALLRLARSTATPGLRQRGLHGLGHRRRAAMIASL